MLEYVYTQKQHKRSLSILLSLWAVDFVIRLVLFIIYGESFVTSSVNLLFIFASGVLVGLIIRALVIRKRSVEVHLEEVGLDPVE